jgi:hypothetical protein
MALHDLTYKAPVPVSEKLMRSTNRLTVLIELFDEGVIDARDVVMGADGYPLAILVNTLEELHMRFTALPHNRDLTKDLVVAIGEVPTTPGEAHVMADELRAFVDQNFAKLSTIYEQHLPTAEPALLVQPEALLIFFLIARDRFTIRDHWFRTEVPYQYLESLANVWGVALPAPA